MSNMPVRLFLLATVTLSLAAAALAEPVQWNVNGHWYELITTPVSWDEADAMAEALTYDGRQGHLATITSQEENDFIFWFVLGGNIPTPLGDPWLGAYQTPPSSDPDANWYWVTDEDWDWTNWDEGEPNDYDEPYAELYLNFQLWGDGAWNDHHGLTGKAFVVEYSGDVVQSQSVTLSDVKALFD